jgi:hypothetical protein
MATTPAIGGTASSHQRSAAHALNSRSQPPAVEETNSPYVSGAARRNQQAARPNSEAKSAHCPAPQPGATTGRSGPDVDGRQRVASSPSSAAASRIAGKVMWVTSHGIFSPA